MHSAPDSWYLFLPPLSIRHKILSHSQPDKRCCTAVPVPHNSGNYQNHMVHTPVPLHLTRNSGFRFYSNFPYIFPIQISARPDWSHRKIRYFPSSSYDRKVHDPVWQDIRGRSSRHSFRCAHPRSARQRQPSRFPCSLTHPPSLSDPASLSAQI